MEKGNESDFTAFCQKTNDAIDKMFSNPADYFTPARGSQIILCRIAITTERRKIRFC